MQFKDKIDNSNNPWLPIIKIKPHAQRPLTNGNLSADMQTHLESMGHIEVPHPYEFEIQNIKYPQEMLVIKPEILYEPLESTPLTWIDTFDKLGNLIALIV